MNFKREEEEQKLNVVYRLCFQHLLIYLKIHIFQLNAHGLHKRNPFKREQIELVQKPLYYTHTTQRPEKLNPSAK